eukprot:COSAG02_NODE_43245_length_376_cov_1.566787_1_plen_91_part_01
MPRHGGGSTGGVCEPLVITPDDAGGAAAQGWCTGMVLPAAFYCPITQGVMQDPVVALDGQSYEYAAIITWFEANQTSPVTSATLRAKTRVR